MGEMAQQAANFQQLASGCECMQSAVQIMGDMIGGGIVGEAMQQAPQQFKRISCDYQFRYGGKFVKKVFVWNRDDKSRSK